MKPNASLLLALGAIVLLVACVVAGVPETHVAVIGAGGILVASLRDRASLVVGDATKANPPAGGESPRDSSAPGRRAVLGSLPDAVGLVKVLDDEVKLPYEHVFLALVVSGKPADRATAEVAIGAAELASELFQRERAEAAGAKE